MELIAPSFESDWDRYFDLRWRVLRAPWGQPKGSEQDEREADSIHLMACDEARFPLAVGRLHFNSPAEAQVRYMAVEPKAMRQGLGTTILEALEGKALAKGAQQIVLNAREQAIPFYIKHGYVATGPADTMFGKVAHVRMEKSLRENL